MSDTVVTIVESGTEIVTVDIGQRGPVGPTGPAGEAGVPGEPGPAGVPGFYHGSGPPSGEHGWAVGSLYMNISNGDLYEVGE